MRFTKMHGIGNDYIYVDCFQQPAPSDPAAISRLVSDRHFGIGSDGLILIAPSDRADACMRMFNADGSEGEMCGNGIRCVGKYLHDHGIARKPRVTVETLRGVLTLDLMIENGKVTQVRVDMDEPILAPSKIPASFRGDQVVDQPLPIWDRSQDVAKQFEQAGVEPGVTCVSMGCPQAVWYCRDVKSAPVAEVGPILENAPFFPRRINVHFVQIQSRSEVSMRTWERGSGITLACGTGASAVCVAGVLTGRTNRSLLAHLPGGDLQLEWSERDNHVYMTGPAVEVFSGDWPMC